MQRKSKHGFWYGFNITAAILSIGFLFLVPLLHAYEQYAQSVDMNLLQTEATTAFEETTITVNIKNTSSTPLNAVEFAISYNPSELTITDIIPASTLCEERFILTKTINSASGTAVFQCGTVTPFTGKEGVVAVLHVTPLQSGTSSLWFNSSTTHVLAHDGLGTDATRNLHNLTLTTI